MLKKTKYNVPTASRIPKRSTTHLNVLYAIDASDFLQLKSFTAGAISTRSESIHSVIFVHFQGRKHYKQYIYCIHLFV